MIRVEERKHVDPVFTADPTKKAANPGPRGKAGDHGLRNAPVHTMLGLTSVWLVD